ncbi:MAG TPA: cytidylate kinase-like family protein [Gemmatimonadales bacterium]|nr:cytidylate kinase-like family protein [Gemmatimonadales bacterium]
MTGLGRPIQIITVSREYGAGGSELAALLGTRMGWRVLDHELIQQLARRLECETTEIAALSEHPPSFLDRLASSGLVTAPESAFHAGPWSTDADRLAALTREVLLEEAEQPPLIVVGHGANCLYRDRPDVLRVRVAAPPEVRIRRVMERTGAAPQQAAADVRHRDADRQHYLQRYYHTSVSDPCAYDLQINTGTVPLDTAAAMIVSLIGAEPR